MIYLNFHFMGNILFNFLPGPQEIAERGYRRLLNILEKYPKIRTHLYLSSRTSLVLKEHFPDVFKMIQKAVSAGRMRIDFNGYEHASFGNLSPDSTIRQIENGFKTDAGLWNNNPHGYWPSDCRWDPYVGYLFRKTDIQWVFIHWETIKQSNPGGQFYSDWRKLDRYRPVNIKCPMNVRIPSLIYQNSNYDIFRPEQTGKFFNELKHIHANRKEDVCYCIGLDFETLLVLEVKEVFTDIEPVVTDFFDRLTKLNYVKHNFSEDILEIMPPEQEAFVRQSNWEHFGGAFPDGAQKILSLCDTAERDLLMCEDLLSLISGCPEAEKLTKEVENVWEHLLIGENSEVRFTDIPSEQNAHTFYPTEKLVLESYEHAIRAYEMARNIKQRLFNIYRDSKKT